MKPLHKLLLLTAAASILFLGVPGFLLSTSIIESTDQVQITAVVADPNTLSVDPSPTLAKEAHFVTTLIAEETTPEPDQSPPELLDYSFENNPLTDEGDLFLNVYDNSGEPVVIEVKEGFFSSWKPFAESELTETPFAIRLTDKSGNSSVIELRETSLDMLPWIAWFTAFFDTRFLHLH